MKKILCLAMAAIMANVSFAQGIIDFYTYSKDTKKTEGESKFSFISNGSTIAPKVATYTVSSTDTSGVFVAGNKGSTGDMTIIMKVYKVADNLELQYTRLKKDNTIDGVWYYRNVKPKSDMEEIGDTLDELEKVLQKNKAEKKAKKEAEEKAKTEKKDN